MKTVADPRVRRSLIERLARLKPDTPRRWGTLTPQEMLCHLGDASAMVLGVRPRAAPVHLRRRLILKGIFLWTPIPWPRGLATNPLHNPRAGGTRPSEFARDLERVIDGIEDIAAGRRVVEPAHGFFGTMSIGDWQRWAYRHTEHHLRQFGL